MANPNPPHVLLNEEYANPVIHRMPSPTSSVGTVYGLDETALSDSEYKLSDTAFARKCEEQMELYMPRKEETEADQDPLLTIPQSGGMPLRISERELDHVEEMCMCYSLSPFETSSLLNYWLVQCYMTMLWVIFVKQWHKLKKMNYSNKLCDVVHKLLYKFNPQQTISMLLCEV